MSVRTPRLASFRYPLHLGWAPRYRSLSTTWKLLISLGVTGVGLQSSGNRKSVRPRERLARPRRRDRATRKAMGLRDRFFPFSSLFDARNTGGGYLRKAPV